MKNPEKTLALIGKLLKERDRINNKRGFFPKFDGSDRMSVITFPVSGVVSNKFASDKHLFYFNAYNSDCQTFLIENEKELIELSKDLFTSEISE